jgi:hypothetical protein
LFDILKATVPFWDRRSSRQVDVYESFKMSSPVHLTFAQSFVGGIVAFRALPRPQFATLQTAIFPVYFSMQTALPVVVALTASKGGQALGLSGLAASENRYNTLLPLATVAITGLINMFVLRPLTVKTMRERKHQGEA